jgi:uncharacterized 2Fe-2S/4Fe-4S cluster protein (DUF4445 family)
VQGDCTIDLQPLGRRIYTRKGANLYQAARDDGAGLASLCGGKGTCGKCRVRIVSGEVSPLDEREAKTLSAEEIGRGYRLACLTEVCGDIKIEIPTESLMVAQRVQLSGEGHGVAVAPAMRALPVNLSRPSRADNRSDQSRLADCLAESHGLRDICVDLYAQRRLSETLRENDWRAKIGVLGNEVVTAGRVEDRLLGLAVDLGTTSIAAYLADLETGETLAAKGAVNPQIAYGEDVVSRVSFAIDGGGETLRQAAVDGLNRLVGELCSEPGLTPDAVVDVVLVGNTVMHHLFLGLPVRQLILAPYVPAVSGPLYTKCRDAGLAVSPGAYIYTMPNIAGFVGGDHVAMLLAAGLYNAGATTIGLDIGTNTEITLSAGGRLGSCSCASGPAFEGAHIKHGMRAAAGAIEKVRIDGASVEVETIDGQRPVGLCGSGVLDAVAQLLGRGIIDSGGKLRSHPGVRHTETGKEFVLVRGDKSGTGKDITLTGQDISEVQLAKGAIASGINILLEKANVAWREIAQVIIAGAFGTYIDVASAIRIGMLPPLPLERFSQVGNAAGAGARLALISRAHRELAVEIAQSVNHVDLTGYPGYPHVFANALRFSPATNWRDGS